MSEDKEGWLWIATSDHVLRVSNQKLSNGVLSSAEVCEYGAADGLPNAKGVKRSRSVVRIRREESGFDEPWRVGCRPISYHEQCYSSSASRRGHYGGQRSHYRGRVSSNSVFS